jgi:hypothetical protein
MSMCGGDMRPATKPLCVMLKPVTSTHHGMVWGHLDTDTSAIYSSAHLSSTKLFFSTGNLKRATHK